ncbi:RHS repeat-associated core domain-containing protein [Actinorhabdospora filicis]|uniref:RHS repeat-associated core domain-containing protein n=1 Tax=Actinorhabdospora filicis TaxID=1785913 RepID=UPI00255301A7|nr:RHS repeat-associated core domain-containing protein [Actinorhabdospora filicis]
MRALIAPKISLPVMSLLLIVGLLPYVGSALGDLFEPKPGNEQESVPGEDAPVGETGPDELAGSRRTEAGPAAWPAGGKATVDLPSDGSRVRAGDLPIYLRAKDGAASTATIELRDHGTTQSLGVTGLLMDVQSQRDVEVTVDYRAFSGAVGGDWSRRLAVVRLTGCPVSAVVGCTSEVLPSENNANSRALSTTLAAAAAPQTLAVTAETSGDSGTFAASSLKPSDSWRAGTATGDFGWTYNVDLPPSINGPTPGIKLSYSSAAADGQTASTNNQPSWVGSGFDYSTGYIERTYKGCVDDTEGSNNSTKTGDLCWSGDEIVTLRLGGSAAQLIKDGKTWRPRTEDGSRIEQLTNKDWANGDNDGEYWRVTTPNGTQYYFGRNQLPGWTTGAAVTNSTWTVPVFGNHTGEQCHADAFSSSWCDQGWRWNLDYVVDVHGNTMSLWYDKEIDRYGRNNDANAVSTYDRGGYVTRIDYGTRSTTSYGTAPTQVFFDVADRCLEGKACDPTKKENWANWPDTPWDLNCKTAPCAGKTSPAFFTTKRLAKITSKVNLTTGTQVVNTYALRHAYIEPGDGTRAGLWLEGITRTGYLNGSTITVPEVTFKGVQLNNRVDGVDNAPPMNWPRLRRIGLETGGEIVVDYSDRDCTPATLPAKAETNNKRCYPIYWTRPGQVNAKVDWFHKYVVNAVYSSDPYGNATSQMVTRYEYLGDPAWRRAEENGLTPKDKLTYSDWRGYERVRTIIGQNGDEMKSEVLYMRGMDGDILPGGSTRSVQVTDSQGKKVTDSNWFAGMSREETIYNTDDGSVVSSTISDPWASAPTATRKIGDTTVTARYISTDGSWIRTMLDGGRAPRVTGKTMKFNDRGQPYQIHDLGDLAVAGDDKCTTTTYIENTSAWIRDLPQEVTTTALPCGTNPAKRDDVISVERSLYDGLAYGATPTKGLITEGQLASDWSAASGATFKTKAKTQYDTHGRVTKSWDVLNRPTTTVYTPTSGGPVTKIVTINAANHPTTTVTDGVFGLPVTVTDANSKTTQYAYDGLGRLIKGWTPGRAKTDTPDVEHDYILKAGTAPAVGTKKLLWNGKAATAYTIYDGLGRERQTQSPSPAGGRVLTDVFYNTAGKVVLRYGAYYNSDKPSTTPFTATDGTLVPNQHATGYDGAGRLTADIFQPFGKEAWRASTIYHGDSEDSVPPAGGSAITTIKDALGRATEIRYYDGSSLTASYIATRYGYDSQNRIRSVTDAAGNQWKYTYDFRGRMEMTEDPDKGKSVMTYDDAGRLLTTTDDRGTTLATTWDALDRKTSVRLGSATGTELAKWVYDTVAKGQLTSSTSFHDGAAYVKAVQKYDNAYRPLQSSVTIPTAEGNLAGTYTTYQSYFADGTPQTTTLPAMGGLPEELLQYVYDDYGLPKQLVSDQTTGGHYVTDTRYDALSAVTQFTLAEDAQGSKRLYRNFTYEPGTNRLASSSTSRSTGTPNVLSEIKYTYDATGNVLSIGDTPAENSAADDVQCFKYDGYRRLKTAWTSNAKTCGDSATKEDVGGTAPYWQSWTFDSVGNRLSETDHLNGSETIYSREGADKTRAHAVATAKTTMASGSSKTDVYGYDEIGNTISRASAQGQQKLTWNPEGRLDTLTVAAKTTSFVYDADGARLVRTDPDGSKKLFLGDTDLTSSKGASVVTGNRYYSWNGQTVAVRASNGKLTWQVSDHHGTASLSVDAATLSFTYRRTTPYGEDRGASAANWPDARGFLGGEQDSSGLTHIGAREYDPNLGSFISVDPLIDPADPQQLHGYLYANGNPVTLSDPTGLSPNGVGGIVVGKVQGVFVRYNGDGPKPPPGAPTGNGWDWFLGVSGKTTYTEGGITTVIWYSEWWWCNADSSVCAGQVQEDGTAAVITFTTTDKVSRFVAPTPYGPYAPGKEPSTPKPQPGCYSDGNGGSFVVNDDGSTVQNAPPEAAQPPPTCGFWDFKCGWNDPTAWWRGNKAWVSGGVAVIGAGTCLFTAGVGCAAVGWAGLLTAAADKGMDALDNYNYYGYSAAGAFASWGLSMSIDVGLMAIPGARMLPGELAKAGYKNAAHTFSVANEFVPLAAQLSTASGVNRFAARNIFDATMLSGGISDTPLNTALAPQNWWRPN